MSIVHEVLSWEVRVGLVQLALVYVGTVLGALEVVAYWRRRRMDGIVARVLDSAERGKVEA